MEEKAWLIEIATPTGAKWFTANNNFTNKPHDALRFARKIDGEAAILMMALADLEPTVTEHIFIA